MKNQNSFILELKVLEEIFLENLMERIEHPEVAEIFERFRDFQCDTENAKLQVYKKIEKEVFV